MRFYKSSWVWRILHEILGWDFIQLHYDKNLNRIVQKVHWINNEPFIKERKLIVYDRDDALTPRLYDYLWSKMFSYRLDWFYSGLHDH